MIILTTHNINKKIGNMTQESVQELSSSLTLQ